MVLLHGELAVGKERRRGCWYDSLRTDEQTTDEGGLTCSFHLSLVYVLSDTVSHLLFKVRIVTDLGLTAVSLETVTQGSLARLPMDLIKTRGLEDESWHCITARLLVNRESFLLQSVFYQVWSLGQQ